MVNQSWQLKFRAQYLLPLLRTAKDTTNKGGIAGSAETPATNLSDTNSLPSQASVSTVPAKKPTSSWEGQPIRIQITSTQPVAVAHLLSTMDPTIKLNDITGNITGTVLVEGKIPDLAPSGEVTLSQISIPAWNVHELNGKVIMSGENKQPNMLQPIAQLTVPSLNIGPLTAKNCKIDLALDAPEDDPASGLVRITGANADIVGGKAELSGAVDLRQRTLQMIVNLTKISAAEATEKLFKLHNQISGDVDMQIKLGTHGKNLHEVLSNFAGDGNIEISNGTIRKMGRLETDLRRVTLLLHQGLFGLNWNSFWEKRYRKKNRNV